MRSGHSPGRAGSLTRGVCSWSRAGNSSEEDEEDGEAEGEVHWACRAMLSVES